MSKFHVLKVASLVKTTRDCTVVGFAIPAKERAHFAFKQGQYLTLKAQINGEEVRRSYSLCTSPLEGEWKVAVKQIPNGKFSTFANETLQVGDELEVMPPAGKFYVETTPTAAKNYVAFAAGSGITPILSIIKTHLAAEPNSRFQLFYTNQSVATIILREEVEALKNQFLERFEIFHFLTRQERGVPLFDGRIDQEKLTQLFAKIIRQDKVDDYFLCGPNEMIFLIRDFLTQQGVANENVHFELFNTNDLGSKRKAQTVIDTSQESEIHIIEGGKKIMFRIPRGSDNVLDAALRNNADLPFACKGGVCCTCRAKLVEGKVDMEVTYGLEPEEIAAGYVLTCQAIPTTEKVVVDFDASMSSSE